MQLEQSGKRDRCWLMGITKLLFSPTNLRQTFTIGTHPAHLAGSGARIHSRIDSNGKRVPPAEGGAR